MKNGNGLVLELQRACIDGSKPVTDILRMAKMIAIKLGLSDDKSWIDYELNGYKNIKEPLPAYRQITGQVKALNPYHGLVPAVFKDSTMEDRLNSVDVSDSVEHLIELTKDDGTITYRFEASLEARLMSMQGEYGQMRPCKVVGNSQIAGILDSIKNRVLDWALELESNGITGENMSFSKDEKDKAAGIHINVEGNIQGNVGQTGGIANQTFNNLVIEPGNFSSLAQHLRNNHIDDHDILELEQAIKEDGTPDNPKKLGPKVSTWVGHMTSKAASGAWNMSIGAGGNLLSEALTKYFGG